MFAVESNTAALALQGPMAKRYMCTLDPMHRPPQNVPFMRMLRLLQQAFNREYKRLIDENVIAYGSRFASSNSDFYQCPERREAYGCIVATMMATQYNFLDGRCLFVSQRTLNEHARTELAIQDGLMRSCDVVISFMEFDGAKTGLVRTTSFGFFYFVHHVLMFYFLPLSFPGCWYMAPRPAHRKWSQAEVHTVPLHGWGIQRGVVGQPLQAAIRDQHCVRDSS